MQQYVDRIIRAAKLDVNLYEEVEADKTSMGQAMGVVVFSSIAAGIGSMGAIGSKGITLGVIAALICWYVWAYVKFKEMLAITLCHHPVSFDFSFINSISRKCVRNVCK
jgi:hypothetical protein